MNVAEWHERVSGSGKEWRKTCVHQQWPRAVEEQWETILGHFSIPITEIPEKRALVEALVYVVAAADEACVGFGNKKKFTDDAASRAISYLERRKTLCEAIDVSRLTVMPKSHNPVTGMTLRSLTHNVAMWAGPEVRPLWIQAELPNVTDGLNILLVPWPLDVPPRSFSKCGHDCNMPDQFGFFTYNMPPLKLAVERVRALFDEAEHLVGKIDAVVFPELSLTIDDFDLLRRELAPTLVIAGVGEAADDAKQGRNEVAIALGDPVTKIYKQAKHHRWRLDWPQIEQYGFGFEFAQHDYWWEAIEIDRREFTVFAADWLTFSVLLCEDLARQDPVAELVRSVGPTLLIALLLDGPQIPARWSARYATVLAEDPRCSVLTLTCAGMVKLAQSQRRRGDPGPRSIALWRDALSGQAQPIILEPGAEAVVIGLTGVRREEWTADGRNAEEHYLLLGGVHQVRPPPDAPSGKQMILPQTAEIEGKELGV